MPLPDTGVAVSALPAATSTSALDLLGVQAGVTKKVPNGTYGALGVLANDPIIFVSKSSKASDTNDGLSVGTAKATLAAALTALGSSAGEVRCLVGTFDHTGLAPSTNHTVSGLGYATTLNNTGTGPNITLNLDNRVTLRDLQLTGVATSTHGIHVIDSLWFTAERVYIQSWGDNSAGLKLDTVTGAGGNGTYFSDLYGLEINGQSRPGSIGIHVTGTAAGANRVRMYGGTVRNCVTGIRLTNGSHFTAFQPEVSGCTTGLAIDGAGAIYSLWLLPSFEANTTHVNISAGADHSFIFPSLAAPASFGTDNGTRTTILSGDPSIVASKLPGGLDILGRVRSTLYGVQAGVAVPISANVTPVTVASTAAETSLQSFTTPANSLAVGDVLEWEMSGVYSAANGVDTVTLRGNVGGGNVVMGLVSTAAGVTDAPWSVRVKVVITEIGTAGKAEVHTTGFINSVAKTHANTATVAIGNTSSAIAWAVTAQWSAALAGNTITARQQIVMASNKK